MHRQGLEMAERGILRPKIVKRDAESERLKFLQNLPCHAYIMHHGALRNLNRHLCSSNTTAVQASSDIRYQASVVERSHGEIHGDTGRRVSCPLAHLGNCSPHYPTIQCADESTFLGHWNELSWAEQ